MKKLPTDDFTLDQTCLLTSEHSTWCLVCDPMAKVISWLSSFLEERLVTVPYSVSAIMHITCLQETNLFYCRI